MGYIYKIENLVNGKVYIGQTKRGPNVRWHQHIHSMNYKSGENYNNHLYSSMRKYGLDNFDFSILDEVEDDHLDSTEKFWIEKYKSNNIDFGYNVTGGGQGRGQIWTQVSQYSVDGRYIKTYASISEAARETGGDRSWIKKICDGHHSISANSQWRYANDDPPRPFFKNSFRYVNQYDIDGELVATFDNAKSADKETGAGYVNILNCLSGRKSSAKGFQWRYLDEKPPGKLEDKKQIPVDQYTLSGEYITTFPSVASAFSSLRKDEDKRKASSISLCCKGKMRSAFGFQWRYANDTPPDPYQVDRSSPKTIAQFSTDGSLLSVYDSIAEAARKTGIGRTNINACCRGKLKTSGGYKWKYIDNKTQI